MCRYLVSIIDLEGVCVCMQASDLINKVRNTDEYRTDSTVMSSCPIAGILNIYFTIEIMSTYKVPIPGSRIV